MACAGEIQRPYFKRIGDPQAKYSKIWKPKNASHIPTASTKAVDKLKAIPRQLTFQL
jgi:hypothetical protein